MYADFTFYVDTFGGTAAGNAEQFTHAAIFADAYLDDITHGRIDESVMAGPFADKVKLAECALVDVFSTTETAETSGIVRHESVGGHSISYDRKTDKELEAQKWRTACLFLRGTGLLYQGLRGIAL